MHFWLFPVIVLLVLERSTSDAAPIEEEIPAKVVEAPGRVMTIQPLATFNHGKPFLAERDPVTGTFDLKTTPVNADDYLYEEFDDSGESIDRKDERVVHTANHIINIPAKDSELHKFLNLPVHYSSASKYPLISSSYANTKIQGHGVSNHRPASTSTTSTVQPSYYPHRTSTPLTTSTYKPSTLRTTSTTSRVPIITAAPTTKTTTTTAAPSAPPPSYEYEYEYDYGDTNNKPSSPEPAKSDYDFMSIFNYFGGGASSTTQKNLEKVTTKPTLPTRSPIKDVNTVTSSFVPTIKTTTPASQSTRQETRATVTARPLSTTTTTTPRPAIDNNIKPGNVPSNNKIEKPHQENTMISIKNDADKTTNKTDLEDDYDIMDEEDESEIPDDTTMDLKPPVKTPDLVMKPPAQFGDKITVTHVEDGGWQGKPELPTELQAPKKVPAQPPPSGVHGNGHMKPYEVRPVGNPYGQQPSRRPVETKDSEQNVPSQHTYYKPPSSPHTHHTLKRPEETKDKESSESQHNNYNPSSVSSGQQSHKWTEENKDEKPPKSHQTHFQPTVGPYSQQAQKRPEETKDRESANAQHSGHYKPNVNSYSKQGQDQSEKSNDNEAVESQHNLYKPTASSYSHQPQKRPEESNDSSKKKETATPNEEENTEEHTNPSKVEKDHAEASTGGTGSLANTISGVDYHSSPSEREQTPRPLQETDSSTINFADLEGPSYRPPPQPFAANQGFHSTFSVEKLPQPPSYPQRPSVHEEPTPQPSNSKDEAGTSHEVPTAPSKNQYRPVVGFQVSRPQQPPQYPNQPPHQGFVQYPNPQQVYKPQPNFPQQPVGFHRPTALQSNGPLTPSLAPQTSEQDEKRPVSWPPKTKPQDSQKVPPFNFFPRPEQRPPSGLGTVEAVRPPPRQPSKGSVAMSSISGDTQSYSLQTSFSIGVPSGHGNDEKVTAGTVSNVPISSIQAQAPLQFPQTASSNTVKYPPPPPPSWEGNLNKPYKEPIKRKPLPNILPQFRPNAKVGTSETSGPHMMGVGYMREPMDRLQPPPLPHQPRPVHRSDEQQNSHQIRQHFPPVRPVAGAYHRTETPPSPMIPPQPVHRRNGVGNKVTNLQMMPSPPPATRKSEEPVMLVYPSNNAEASTTKEHWRQPLTDFGNDDEFPHDLEENRTKDTPILKVKPTTKPQLKVDFPYPLVKPLPDDETKDYQSYVPTASPVKKQPSLETGPISHHIQDHNPAFVTISSSPSSLPPKRLIPNEGEFGWSVIGSRVDDDLTTTPFDSASSTSGPMAPPQLSGGFRPIPAPNLD